MKSPCVRNCRLNENNICTGCFRTISEIIEWPQADIEKRKTILHMARQRKKEIDNQ
ncbi:DUF1289 domain-containing protein [Gammaproteobacteria bacterium]|jgi:predicted Fe-S protein YdhL (DUF1289 family)|nr:DUF1289 domain-containing protein [Gammaproteobacteria bacterium]